MNFCITPCVCSWCACYACWLSVCWIIAGTANFVYVSLKTRNTAFEKHETQKAEFGENVVGKIQTFESVYQSSRWYLFACTCWREQLWPWKCVAASGLLANLVEKTCRFILQKHEPVSLQNVDFYHDRTSTKYIFNFNVLVTGHKYLTIWFIFVPPRLRSWLFSWVQLYTKLQSFGQKSHVCVFCWVLAAEEPSGSGGRAYSVCEVFKGRVLVLLRPPIRYRCRCTSDSLLAFRLKMLQPKN
jgi:hypothetical protein